MGYRNTLITLDGSELAEYAIKPALMAVEPGTKIHLLSVTEEMTSTNTPMVSPINGKFAVQHTHHVPLPRQFSVAPEFATRLDYLNSIQAGLVHQGYSVTVEVTSGQDVEEAIVEQACHFDLLAMATHGRSGFSKLLLGSVTESILHKTPCPLLIAPARAGQMTSTQEQAHFNSILVSLDGTPESEIILPEVEMLLAMHPCKVILLKVTPYVAFNAEELSHDEYLLLNDAAERREREYLEGIAERLRKVGATPIVEANFDLPADAIRFFAHYYNVDLIAMATHGRTGVNRLLHGSVTEQVMHHTLRPMLITRGFSESQIWREY